jgi:hypothetical protein
MSTHKDRIISEQQRTIAKYERALSELRMLVEGAKATHVGAGSTHIMTDRLDAGAPFIVTRSREPVAAVLPLKDLEALGVISE